jgi:NTP pyrophosphatase (non-canonical NTP hydrolase)
MIFRKFPYVCPYCRKEPHNDAICKAVRGAKPTVDHEALRTEYERNWHRRPATLNEWQKMFQDIYPRSTEDRGRSSLGLLEELGELAEAIRVYERHPKYFIGEAADVFSYLMGLANEHSIRLLMREDKEFSIEEEYINRYWGLCAQCGYRVCICPPIPESTVGRMAKELGVEPGEALFLVDDSEMYSRGKSVADQVFSSLASLPTPPYRFPFDRGEANSILMFQMIDLAEKISEKDPVQAKHLLRHAYEIGKHSAIAGSILRKEVIEKVIKPLEDKWPEVAPTVAETLKIELPQPTIESKSRLARPLRVLLVFANPIDSRRLELDSEERSIREAVRLSRYRDCIELTTMLAATTDDLRRKLLDSSFDLLHFSGHGSPEGAIFADLNRMSVTVKIEALRKLVAEYRDIKCVLLNSCFSLKDINESLCDFTIGMTALVGDSAAIAFATGFYDALGAGFPYPRAIKEGQIAVGLKNLSLPLKILTKEEFID